MATPRGGSLLKTSNAVSAFLILALVILSAGPALAEGWQASLFGHPYGPGMILAVDKNSQKFFIFQQKSPLRVATELPCTTGKDDGDKLKEGDMRTPEGVYFIQSRLTEGLDYGLYGDLAYTLNYPNPMDKIAGKTGHGIWIHGRGAATINPRDTKGCVVLSPPDLKAVAKDLSPGTPVLIARGLSWAPEDSARQKTVDELAQAIKSWAGDWSRKNDRFFEFFDPKGFEATESESFKAFRDHKLSVFKSQPWIQVMVDNIHALPGPDYWVTCFDQFYRSPTLTTQDGKRVYWKKDASGKWRIMATEHVPVSRDLEPVYLEKRRGEVEKLLAGWRQAWQSASLDLYLSYYHPKAKQGVLGGREAIAQQKKGLWASKKPVKVRIEDAEVGLHSQGLEVTFTQTFSDSSGLTDKGVKTLVLAPQDDDWIIVEEDWKKM